MSWWAPTSETYAFARRYVHVIHLLPATSASSPVIHVHLVRLSPIASITSSSISIHLPPSHLLNFVSSSVYLASSFIWQVI